MKAHLPFKWNPVRSLSWAPQQKDTTFYGVLCSSSFEMVSMFFLNPTEVSTFTSMVAKSNKCNEIKWVSFSRAAFFYSYSLSKTYFSSSTFNYTLSFPVVHQAVDKLDPLFSSLNCQHPLCYTQKGGVEEVKATTTTIVLLWSFFTYMFPKSSEQTFEWHFFQVLRFPLFL